MNVWPAIVTVPVRAPEVLGATVNPTLPLPVALAPEVTEIHGALLVALHAHPAAVLTATGDPGPPAAAIDCDVGRMEYAHAVAAAWFKVNLWPAIVTVPVRAADVLAATVKPTVPLPLPVAPEVTTIHGSSLLALHGQPAGVVTATGDPEPPSAPID